MGSTPTKQQSLPTYQVYVGGARFTGRRTLLTTLLGIKYEAWKDRSACDIPLNDVLLRLYLEPGKGTAVEYDTTQKSTGFVIVFNVCQKESFEEALRLIKAIKQGKILPGAQWLLVGTNADRATKDTDGRQVKPEEANALVDALFSTTGNGRYIEVCALKENRSKLTEEFAKFAAEIVRIQAHFTQS